jgi:hypothetical protein
MKTRMREKLQREWKRKAGKYPELYGSNFILWALRIWKGSTSRRYGSYSLGEWYRLDCSESF